MASPDGLRRRVPDDFLWRKKAQFGDGSGADSVLQQRMEESVTEEEVAYYRIFAENLGEVRPRHTIGRFATA